MLIRKSSRTAPYFPKLLQTWIHVQENDFFLICWPFMSLTRLMIHTTCFLRCMWNSLYSPFLNSFHKLSRVAIQFVFINSELSFQTLCKFRQKSTLWFPSHQKLLAFHLPRHLAVPSCTTGCEGFQSFLIISIIYNKSCRINFRVRQPSCFKGSNIIMGTASPDRKKHIIGNPDIWKSTSGNHNVSKLAKSPCQPFTPNYYQLPSVVSLQGVLVSLTFIPLSSIN